MSRTVTSKESILVACKDIVRESGMPALNMRNVAQRCQVAVGSIYNYFPSKEDLILATVASIWNEILSFDKNALQNTSFIEVVQHLFNNVQAGAQTYPLFLIIHSMSFMEVDKEKGRQAMNHFFGKIEDNLLSTLKADPNIRQDVFTDEFTEKSFVRFVISNVLALIINRSGDIKFLEQIIQKTIY